jgi:hypothetical protein
VLCIGQTAYPATPAQPTLPADVYDVLREESTTPNSVSGF